MLPGGLIKRVLQGAVATLGLSLLATTAIGSTASGVSRNAVAHPPRPDVVVVGDSLVHQIAPIESQLLDRSGHVADIEARDSQDLGSAFVQRRIGQAAAEGTRIVVLETASNDAYHGAGTAPPAAWTPELRRYQQTLAATLETLSHQCTVLVDTRVDHTSPWYGLGRIGEGIDQAIDDAALRHPGTVEVVHWARESASHESDWFWRDGLHFGDPAQAGVGWHEAGAKAFADAIASGVRRCSADLQAAPVTRAA
jgi:hypothetical protein